MGRDAENYENNILNLRVNEQKLRDLSLREIALQNIPGTMTGYPSQDKPWLKFYDKSYIEADIPHMTAVKYFEKLTDSNIDDLIIDALDGKYTNYEFRKTYNKVACSLYQLGIKKGDKSLFMLLPMALESILLYAHNLIGGIITGIPTQSTAKEICKSINNLGIDILFTVDLLINKEIEQYIYNNTNLSHIVVYDCNNSFKNYDQNRTLFWDDFLQISDEKELPIVDVKPEDIVFIAQTGGTTGNPKSVCLDSNSFNIAVHQYINSDLNYNRGDKWLRLWSLFSATAAVSNNHLPLCLGMQNILRCFPLDITKFDDIVVQEKCNHLLLVPQLLDVLEKSNIISNENFDYIKTIGCGGMAITNDFEERVQEFFNRFNINTFLGYGWGCTENGAAATMRSNFETTYIGTVGVPLVNTIVSVFDPVTLEEKTYNQEGELCIQSYTVMKGYYNDDELTNKVIKIHQDGTKWLHTGDLGIINSDGIVTVKGRITRTIFTLTEKIYPSMLENIISQVDGVQEVAIGQIPDLEHEGFSVPICFAVAKPEYDIDVVKDNIEKICILNFKEYTRPKYIYMRDCLPLTNVGKVDILSLEKEIMESKQLVLQKRKSL